MRRSRFQQGSLKLVERKGGRKAWEYRWYEVQPDGSRRRRNLVLGTLEQYPNETAAQKAVAVLRVDINAESPRMNLAPISIQMLIDHYREKELCEDSGKTYATRRTYEGYFRKWILPRWGTYRVKDVRSVAVEEWLRSLKLSNGSKAKMRNIMHAVFNHAMRYEWFKSNPISLVRQSAKRLREPDILIGEEIAGLLLELHEPFRTMVFVAATTGLRRSELFGLKWVDVDFAAKEIRLCRAVVHQVVGDLKTDASKKPVALDPDLASTLQSLKDASEFKRPDDWVFASPKTGGIKPYWPDTVLDRQVLPAARRSGITKKVGWHTFRRSYATLLKASGADVKVVQDSLRHANARITMEIYAQALTPDKRKAQTNVVQMILPKQTQFQAAGNAG